jgi:hypothetical protein
VKKPKISSAGDVIKLPNHLDPFLAVRSHLEAPRNEDRIGKKKQ